MTFGVPFTLDYLERMFIMLFERPPYIKDEDLKKQLDAALRGGEFVMPKERKKILVEPNKDTRKAKELEDKYYNNTNLLSKYAKPDITLGSVKHKVSEIVSLFIQT